MYYQDYEDYMRSVLGYPIDSKLNTYETFNNNYNFLENQNYTSERARYSSEILNLYPEVYNEINPMVCKICDVNTKPITKELIDKMTEEIYISYENNIDTNEIENIKVSSNIEKNNTTNNNLSNRKIDNRNKEERQTRRANDNLRDLIKILILNRLLGRYPNNSNNCFMPPPKPPIMPPRPRYPNDNLYYNDYYNF